MTAEGETFNRKRDRMSFKEDQNKPRVERQYANGVPLLLDLNEILNLDVIAMAMKEQEQRKRSRKKKQVMPEMV